MERAAFLRARAYLNYSPRAKLLALVAGALTGVFYVVLVLLFAIQIDLLVSRGRVPNFAQLSVPEQEQFLETWKALPSDARAQALQHLGYGEFDASSAAPLSEKPDDKQRFSAWNVLLAADKTPPLPGKMDGEELKKWAQGKPFDDPYIAAMREHELRWRAYVWLYLHDRIGPEAADSYLPKVSSGEQAPVPGLGEDNRIPHGVLSLVVRLRGTFASKLLNPLAALNPWMWQGGSKDVNRIYLTGLLLLAIGAALLAATCMVLMNLYAARAAVEAVVRIRRSVYHHASRLGELALQSSQSPAAQGIFVRQIESIHDALYLWLTTVSRYPAQIGLLSGLALLVQPWLALAVILFALLVWLMGGHIVAAFRRQGRAASKVAASRVALMLEGIMMMRLVKAYLMDLFNQSRIERHLADYAKAQRKRYRGEAFAKPVLLLLVALASITLLYLSGRIVLSDGLSLAGLTILVVAVSGMYPPLKGWLDIQKYMRRGNEASTALFEFLDRKGSQIQFPDAEFLQPMSKGMEFKEVSLLVGANRPLLEDVNLTVRAGEKIGIVGADDEAKRALLFLIPRFFDPSEGEIRIDGRNLKWVTHESLRAQIGLVTLDNLIFNDTVLNNIGCGDPSINLPRIFEAAKLAHAHQFIQLLPYGYETSIGEFGHSLRIGEQFRVALARAIVRDPAIYIIEEPAIALDDDTRAMLDDTLNRVLPGKTVFFLPHRISTLKRCDRVVLVNERTIEAVGEHRELVRDSDLYKHLYYMEFNAFAEQV